MTSEKEQEKPQSEVAKFYDGKTVLVTGTAGFLGTILLEILLRCCPGIHRIYILLREKRDMLPEERKEVIFKKNIFSKIREKCPAVLDKVTVISGDVSYENFGMNDDDLRKVVEEVSMVFQVAASINFLKPLRFILIQNVIATYNAIELCRKLKHVDALVYTSTAYSNSNRKTMDEIVYKMPFKAEDSLDIIRKGDEEELRVLYERCTPKFLNFYTFSKCLAENLLAETAADLPVSIVRPSAVVCTWKGSLPGYIEDKAGMYSLILGVGKGFLRVIQINKELVVDHIPSDIVANTHLVAAWRQVTERLSSPSVYNCTSTDILHYTWDEFSNVLLELVKKHPLPNSYQTPSLKIVKSNVAYYFFSILEHYYPAVVIDTLLRLSGRKPRLVKLYRFYDKMMSVMQTFILKEWRIPSANFQSLAFKLNSTDSEVFPVDIRQYCVEEITNVVTTGAPMYNWEKDKKSCEERVRAAYVQYLVISFIKWSFIGLSIFMCYRIIF